MLFSSQVFYMSILITSSLLSMFSKTWLVVWTLLELNTLSFLMTMLENKVKEKLLIFFIFQASASSMLMVYIFFPISSSKDIMMSGMMVSLIMMSMMMKIGLFPFHPWVLLFCEKISWDKNTMLLTWQKIIPTVILIKCYKSFKMDTMLITSMTLLSLIMLKMSKMKSIMVMSSSIHTSWMTLLILMNSTMTMVYLMVYSSLLWLVNKYFKNSNSSEPMNLSGKEKTKKSSVLLMLTLSGMPPFIGFLLKMMVFMVLMKNQKLFIFLAMMVLSSSANFFVYICLIYKNIMNSFYSPKKWLTHDEKSKKTVQKIMVSTPILMLA